MSIKPEMTKQAVAKIVAKGPSAGDAKYAERDIKAATRAVEYSRGRAITLVESLQGTLEELLKDLKNDERASYGFGSVANRGIEIDTELAKLEVSRNMAVLFASLMDQ